MVRVGRARASRDDRRGRHAARRRGGPGLVAAEGRTFRAKCRPIHAGRAGSRAPGYWSSTFPHDVWMQAQGIPIHKGYFIEDLRTVELGWWEERECQAAFIQLQGRRASARRG